MASNPNVQFIRVARTQRYKLLRQVSFGPAQPTLRFHDLWNDPFELVNLAGALTPEQQAAFDLLDDAIDELRPVPPVESERASTRSFHVHEDQELGERPGGNEPPRGQENCEPASRGRPGPDPVGTPEPAGDRLLRAAAGSRPLTSRTDR